MQTSHIFRLDQRAAIYLGRLGGERNGDGSYNMGLVYTRMSSRTTSRLLADVKPGTIRTGYARIKTAELLYGTDNMDNGKTATRHLAENTYNQNWLTLMSRFHRKMRPDMCYCININTLPVLLAQERVMTETEMRTGMG